MIRLLSVLWIAFALGCQSTIAPIDDVAPLSSPDAEAVYSLTVSGEPSIRGSMAQTGQGERVQTRTVIEVDGEARFRSVQDTISVSGQLTSFRYVSRGSEEQVYRGIIQGKDDDLLVVKGASGDVVTELEWSPAHRIGGPNPNEIMATGFEPGATVTATSYLPWHDAKGAHLVGYTIQGPTTWRDAQGKEVPAHRLTVQSPQPTANGSQWIVDTQGRLLEATFYVPGNPFGHELSVRLESRLER